MNKKKFDSNQNIIWKWKHYNTAVFVQFSTNIEGIWLSIQLLLYEIPFGSVQIFSIVLSTSSSPCSHNIEKYCWTYFVCVCVCVGVLKDFVACYFQLLCMSGLGVGFLWYWHICRAYGRRWLGCCSQRHPALESIMYFCVQVIDWTMNIS